MEDGADPVLDLGLLSCSYEKFLKTIVCHRKYLPFGDHAPPASLAPILIEDANC